jgi:hypothetical protein
MKKPKTHDDSGFGLLWMRPAPGQLAKGLAALKREREELEWQRLETRPKATRPTSISIVRKIARYFTAHISSDGLAPETHAFVAALNTEAKRYGIDVTFSATFDRILVSGDDIQAAATDPTTMIGYFLQRQTAAGFLNGEEYTQKKGNSDRRKHLRKYAKTKAGMAEAAKAEAEGNRQTEHIRRVAAAHGQLHELIRAIPAAERDRLDLDPEEYRVTHIPLPLRGGFQDPPPEGTTGSRPTKTGKRRPLK